MSPHDASPVAFHDLWDPLAGKRSSIRIEAGHVVEVAESVAGTERNVDGSSLWVLPALYDADEHTPFASVGIRETDRLAALCGGIARLNVAIHFQEVRDRDLDALAVDAQRHLLPEVVPVLAISDKDSDGFPEWISVHADEVKALFPPVCKLYSSDANFWENLDAIWGAQLLPIVYCYDQAALLGVVERAKSPVHFRHAYSKTLVETMRRVEGATLQTSPHFVLPVPSEVRSQLWVLPPVADDEVRATLLEVFLDEIDLFVTDHNAPPFQGEGKGPGLRAAHTFLPAVLTSAKLNNWPLDRVLAKATSAPASRFGVDLGDSFAIVDPEFEAPPELWPGQGPDRAPFSKTALQGRVLAVSAGEQAVLL